MKTMSRNILTLIVTTSLLIADVAIAQNFTSERNYDHAILLSSTSTPHGYSYGIDHLNTEDPVMNFYNGIHMMNTQDLEQAEFYFDKVLSKQPDNPQVYHWLARINILRDQHNKAIEMATKSLQLNPGHFQTHLDLFVAYSKLGLQQEAHHHLFQASTIDPDYISKRAARLIIEKDDLKTATYMFKIVHQATPGSMLNSLNYGRSLIMSGQLLEAEKVLESGYQLNSAGSGHFDLLYTMYFNALLDNRQYDKILTISSEKVSQSYYHQYYYRAMGHFHKGDLEGFDLNARLYFQYQGKTAPKSLINWAMANNNFDNQGAD